MENYKKTKVDITKIINSIDPYGLISAGAPEDEYNAYIDRIISLYLDKKLDNENLKKIWNTDEISNEVILEIREKVNDYFIKNN